MQKVLHAGFLILFCLSKLSAQTTIDSIRLEKNESFQWFPKLTNNQENKGKFYAYWGYNRSQYLDTKIHFSSPNYDFTLFDVKAKDRPSKFSLRQYFKPSNITIPQYNYRIGYFMNDRWLVSGGLDHMKYVVTNNQRVAISGVISEVQSAQFAGTYLLDTIALTTDFLKFEHTDGLNLLTLDFEYLQPVAISKTGNFKLKWNLGIGGIWVVTRTNVSVMGDGIDNDFHVAGFSLAAKTGPRFDIFKHFFISTEFKAAYMAIPDVLIENAAPKRADHTLITFEEYVVVGGYFDLRKKNRNTDR